MKVKISSLCLLILCLVHSLPFDCQAAARRKPLRERTAPTLSPSAFAHRVSVDGAPGQLLSLAIPETVHRGLQRPDFRDLCVFDQGGLPVPFTLNGEQNIITRSRRDLGNLPFYVWKKKPVPESQTGARTDIFINNTGSSIRVHTEGLVRREAEQLALLVDCDALFRVTTESGLQPQAPTLRLVVANPNLVTSVRLSSSQDLGRWRAIGKEQTLAKLEYQETRLDRLEISLPQGHERFLLLQFTGDEPEVTAINASMVLTSTHETFAHSQSTGLATPSGTEVLYDLGGRFPLERLDFRFTSPDAISVTVHGRESMHSPWRRAAHLTLFTLERKGLVVHNDPVPVPSSMRHYRYWRLEANNQVRFAVPPELSITYTPLSVTFLARGEGPWILAWGGQIQTENTSFPAQSLAETLPAKIIEAPIPAYDPPVQNEAAANSGDLPWLLWGSLILAVLALSIMALYLLRQANRSAQRQE